MTRITVQLYALYIAQCTAQCTMHMYALCSINVFVSLFLFYSSLSIFSRNSFSPGFFFLLAHALFTFIRLNHDYVYLFAFHRSNSCMHKIERVQQQEKCNLNDEISKRFIQSLIPCLEIEKHRFIMWTLHSAWSH